MSTVTSGLMARYIERRHGREDTSCEIQALYPFFASSYGLPLYREQLQAIAQAVAGFDPAAAARFASAFCRFDEAQMPDASAGFIEGARNLGVAVLEAAGMVSYFMRTAPFMIPESLVSGFAAEGYRLAWLKTHYREDFDTVRLGMESGLY